MRNRTFLLAMVVVVVGLAYVAAAEPPAGANDATRLNVLLIVSDDLNNQFGLLWKSGGADTEY